MFGKFMNNYYYGKSGKGDYNPEDLPKTRWQLFMEMLRTRLSALCRLNLIYVLPWLPTIAVLGWLLMQGIGIINEPEQLNQTLQMINAHIASQDADGSIVIPAQEDGGEAVKLTKEQIESAFVMNEVYSTDNAIISLAQGSESVQVTMADGTVNTYTMANKDALLALDDAHTKAGLISSGDRLHNLLQWALLLLIPCVFITGPWTAGVTYVTRNWARDEHAFLWADMKDAMKENWKGALVLSGITSIVPIVVYLCWQFYGEQPADSMLTSVLLQLGQMIPFMVGVIWYMALTYAYPMMVTYRMSMKTVLRNSLILAVGRLPQSAGIRVLHCVPALLMAAGMWLFNNVWVLLAYLMYYVFIGFSLSRFITASFTNAQFDKYINSRIEGAKVNQGLAEEDDEDYDEEEEEREIKPWENGYANRDDA